MSSAQPTSRPSIDRRTDADLLGSSGRDANDAFREVFDRHASVIHRFLTLRVGSDLADDLVSETFARAWRHRARFDYGARSARPWLFGIAANVVVEERRIEARWRASIESAHAPMPASPPEVSTDRKLVTALGALSPAERDVVLLRVVSEMRFTDIARTLGISVTAARVRAHRGMRKLEREYKGNQLGEGEGRHE